MVQSQYMDESGLRLGFGDINNIININFKRKECPNHSAFSVITFHNCVIHSNFEALGGCTFSLSDFLLGPECMGF